MSELGGSRVSITVETKKLHRDLECSAPPAVRDYYHLSQAAWRFFGFCGLTPPNSFLWASVQFPPVAREVCLTFVVCTSQFPPAPTSCCMDPRLLSSLSCERGSCHDRMNSTASPVGTSGTPGGPDVCVWGGRGGVRALIGTAEWGPSSKLSGRHSPTAAGKLAKTLRL